VRNSPPARIAVVEDEFVVALDMQRVIERAGHIIAGVFSSAEDLLARFAEVAPDLVLMDIKLKGAMDGIEAARTIGELHEVPVVFLTAWADDSTIERALPTGPFGYVTKPFEERDLRSSIELALFRSAMERRLKESEERYRKLFHEGISGNFLAERDGRIVEANQAFIGLLGLSAADGLPPLPELFPDRAAWDAFSAALDESASLSGAEISLRRSDGREALVIANVSLGSSGRIQGALSDATERKELEERLGASQKMEAIGRLAGGIAHDFNNILTAIMGYANLLSVDAPPDPVIAEDIEGIKKASARAANLTKQLLAFSRRQAFAPKVLDLGSLVADMEKMLVRLLTPETRLSVSRVPGELLVVADSSQIEQILINLVVNARDAMPGGGVIDLALRRERIESSRRVGLDTLARGDYLILEVRDDGMGIDPAIQGRIFEPFFTTKGRDKGTGLGLAMVYGIAKQAGGAVSLVSALGKGACFSVWIPAARATQAQEPQPLEGQGCHDHRRATILLVEDDAEIRGLALRFLERAGHTLLAAASPGEALLIAESYGRTIDLLLTDIVMPLMDGVSLSRRIRRILPKAKFLFITGNPERAAEREGSSLLLKPFSEEGLLAAVDAALGPVSTGPRE
jgi:PAS domain S-box-containing protein